jgi:hypothetical protein
MRDECSCSNRQLLLCFAPADAAPEIRYAQGGQCRAGVVVPGGQGLAVCVKRVCDSAELLGIGVQGEGRGGKLLS